MEKQKIVKITIVGDSTVGKTCLVHSYIGKEFSDKYIPTVLENVTKSVGNYDLLICDTAGREEYSILTRTLNYPLTNVFIVSFALNDHNSYTNVKLWYKEVYHYVPDAALVLVGTKLDDENRTVLHKNAVKLQKELKACFYVECSAKNGININDVFDSATKAHFAAINKERKARSCALL